MVVQPKYNSNFNTGVTVFGRKGPNLLNRVNKFKLTAHFNE